MKKEKTSFDEANELALASLVELKSLDDQRVRLEDKLARKCWCVIKKVISDGLPADLVHKNYYLALRNCIITSNDQPENFASYLTNELKRKTLDSLRNEGRIEKQNLAIKTSTYFNQMHADTFETLEGRIKLEFEIEKLDQVELDL